MKKLLDEIDSLNLNVSLIYVVFAQNYKEIEYVQFVNSFTYPLYYDYSGKTNQINHLPKNLNLQTFLLDSANRVILIGDPLKNKNIWSLYKNNIKSQQK